MSGRLVILPKKTYCPWRPENVERVLRDERLERERLENDEKERIDEKRRSRARRAEGDGAAGAGEDGGHVNLFPEAREAELKLARGEKAKEEALRNNGILPVPLGGDEATKRKSGAVPFYLRASTDGGKEEVRYEGSTGGLGFRRNRVAADAVTDAIMRDQYASREDSRKGRMDPMGRFFGKGTDASPAGKGRPARPAAPPASAGTKRGGNGDGPDGDSDSHRRGRKHKRRKHSRRDEGGDESDCSDGDGGKKRSGRRKSRRKHHRRRGDDGLDGLNDDVEELRRRRLEREARESAREWEVLGGTLGGVGGRRGDDRARCYQDQFNPAFSRK